jgi:2-polyprenyl-3-methyl-5-hydroxy-6-metoxy-1,4-benzoquinol methylase
MAAATAAGANPEGSRDFALRLVDIINDAGVALLLSIGHRTGLFDVLVERSLSTPEEIAEAAQLEERCVRKWVEAMVKAGIVSRHPDSGGYGLPAEHAEHLSGAAPPRNLAAVAGFVPLLGAVEDQIVEQFHKSGHTPYDARPSFRQVVSRESQESDEAVIKTLIDSVLAIVPGLTDMLRSGIDVLDVGCGRGRAVNLMASTFPNSRFHGFDPSRQHVDDANWRAFAMGLTNVNFHEKAVADLDERARYDLILDFDAIRHERRPRQVLESIAQALRPGGTFLMQEVAALSHVDAHIGLGDDSALLAAASLAAPNQEANVPGGVHGVITLLLEPGFESVAVHHLPHHIYNCFFVATKARS